MTEQVDVKEAIKRKYPEPVAYAIAKDKNGKANPITLGWVMWTSHQPPMLAVSIGTGKYSCDAIGHSKCFTVAYPDHNHAEEALFFGTNSGRKVDKFTEYGSPTAPATRIDSVILEDAVANFECVLEGEMVTGDHTVFVGRVVASHVNKDSHGRLYTLAPGWKMGGVRPATT